MTALSTRNALVKALCHEYHPMHWDVAYGNRAKPCEACQSHAARLIASGAVVDAATLTDDPRAVVAISTETFYDDNGVSAPGVARVLRALAGLTERGDTE